MTDKYEKFINDPFYIEAAQMSEKVRRQQIIKGAEKYGVAFSPDNHTLEELLQHAMEENMDQQHYIVGIAKKAKQIEQAQDNVVGRKNEEIQRLTARMSSLEDELSYWKEKANTDMHKKHEQLKSAYSMEVEQHQFTQQKLDQSDAHIGKLLKENEVLNKEMEAAKWAFSLLAGGKL